MIDLDILRHHGVTNEELRACLTADPNTTTKGKEEEELLKHRVKVRRRLERMFESRTSEAVAFSLRNYHLYSAVDMAWDSTPINKATVPLVLYAQKRISAQQCLRSLTKDARLDNKEIERKYARRSRTNEQMVVKSPRLSEVNVNLIRSLVSRRAAAQSNRFSNLWPFFKYEPRGTSPAAKLRSELVSQRMDVMADQLGYRDLQSQIIRDLFLYSRAVIFPNGAWQRDVKWEKGPTGDAGDPQAVVEREGVPWTLPHPSRTFYDINHPMRTLNTDSGCTYCGYWDVVRYGDLLSDPMIFNKSCISYSVRIGNWLKEHGAYFNQYWNDIISPTDVRYANLTTVNERVSNVGLYNAEMEDSSCFLTDYYFKAVPRDIGIGAYPYPVWFHVKLANFRTCVFAEILPSRPAAVFSYNESDNRLVNLSMAMELMPLQDQLNNLTVQLLEASKRDLFTVAVLNVDIFPTTEEGQKARTEFENMMKSEHFYSDPLIISASFQKLRQLNIEPSADNIFKIVRSSDNSSALNQILNAINQVWMAAERMVVLSPQEQGQVSPREITATEVQIVATTTEAVYNFISDAIDSGRAAWKQICYETLISMSDEEIELPLVHKYPRSVVEAAEFDIVENSGQQFVFGDVVDRYTVRSPVGNLATEMVFTARDGAERSSDTQAGKVLSELYARFLSTPIAQQVNMEKHIEIMAEIFRLSGSSIDMSLDSLVEPQAGGMGPPNLGGGPVPGNVVSPPVATGGGLAGAPSI